MDPLSLTASILTVLGANYSVMQGLEQLASLRHAPNTILALNNEISDFKLVALEANAVLREHRDQTCETNTSQSIAASLGPVLDHAREKLLELECLLEYRLTSPGANGKARLNKSAWLHQQSKFKQIRKDIRSIKSNLFAAMGTLTFRTASRMELQVTEMRLLGNDLQSQHRQQRALTVESLNCLGSVASTLPRMVAAQGRIERVLDELLRAHVMSQRETTVSRSKNVFAQRNAMTSVNEAVGQLSLQLRLIRKADHSVCLVDCTCHCHERSTLRSPLYSQSLLGLLFVGYVGLPWLSPGCDNIKCQEKADPVISVRYLFPGWFMARAVEFVVRISKLNGLTQNLRMSRVVWFGSRIFALSGSGDAEEIKKLLIRREGSSFDVSYRHGETPLAVCSLRLACLEYYELM